jgi:hypothetical protein
LEGNPPNQQLFESVSVEDGDAEVPCPLQLRARLLAGEHVVRVLADGGGEGAPGRLEPLDVVVAGALKGARYDDALAGERSLGRTACFTPEVEATLHQAP